MKKVIFLAACWFTLNQGMAQFQHSYGTPETEVGWSLTDLSKDDGRYLIGGYTSREFFGSVEATLIKADPVGNQIWSNVYGGTKTDYFTSARQAASSDFDAPTYVAAGITNSFGFGMDDAWLMGTDKDGAPLFSQVYGGKNMDRVYCLQNVRPVSSAEVESGYVMVGETMSYDWAYPGSNVYVIRTDLWGNLKRATVIGGYGDQRGYWIEQTKDGGFIVVGSTNYPNCNPAPTADQVTDIFVIRLKPDLTMAWNRIIGFPDFPGPVMSPANVARCVKETEEGFIITGYSNMFGLNNSYDAFLLTLDKNGSFTGMRTYGTPENNEYGMSLVAGLNEDGKPSYTVLANNLYPGSSYEALLFQTDLSLNLLWAQNYGGERYELALELTSDHASRYGFTGYTNSIGAGGADIYLVETKLNGTSGTACEKRIDLKELDHKPCITRSAQQVFVDDARVIQHAFKEMRYEESRCSESGLRQSGAPSGAAKSMSQLELFPSPADRQLTIRFTPDKELKDVNIFGLDGRKAAVMISGKNQNEWLLSTEKLESGIYIIESTFTDGTTVTRRFIKE